jgi:hypothetical protein
MRCRIVVLVLVAIATHAGQPAWAEDSRLTIQQVPDEQQRGQSARDEGLLPDDAPERCADPEVAAEDPACIEAQDDDGYVSKGYDIPVIKDLSQDGLELIPGVTVNQPPSGRLP